MNMLPDKGPEATTTAFFKKTYQSNGLFYNVLTIALLAAVSRIVFWAYTNRIWEDALITILHAENAVSGIGLTHFKINEGVIHGFTSPLSVLIPLAGEYIHAGFGLDFMRIASVISSIFTVLIAAKILQLPDFKVPMPLTIMACSYIAFEHHQILWGMAGMETQVVCLSIIFSIYSLLSKRTILLGVSLGINMLARPDYGFWVVIVGLFLMAEAFKTKNFKRLFTVVAIASFMYIPWIIFTWTYYGSPIPNTILAKSTGYPFWWKHRQGWISIAIHGIKGMGSLFSLLGPSFGGNGTNFTPFAAGKATSLIMLLFAIIGIIKFALERKARALVVSAFVLTYATYYEFLVPAAFGWYLVPLNAVAILLSANGVSFVSNYFVNEKKKKLFLYTVSFSYIAIIISVLPTTFKGEKNIQELVENKVRVAIGDYLREKTTLDTTIGGEPLGFIGYHSRRTYYDYPGLTSRKIVEYMKNSGMTGLLNMLQEFRPDFIVLRDQELEMINSSSHKLWFYDLYALDSQWSVPDADREQLLFPKKNIDMSFGLYKKRQDAPKPITISLAEMEEPIDGFSISTSGAMSCQERNKYIDEKPFSGEAVSSFTNGDNGRGITRITLPRLKDASVIGIPFITGKDSYNLKLRLIDMDTSETIASLGTLRSLDALPVSPRQWRVWQINLPPDVSSRNLALEGEDYGDEQEQWFAFGVPHKLKDNARP